MIFSQDFDQTALGNAGRLAGRRRRAHLDRSGRIERLVADDHGRRPELIRSPQQLAGRAVRADPARPDPARRAQGAARPPGSAAGELARKRAHTRVLRLGRRYSEQWAAPEIYGSDDRRVRRPFRKGRGPLRPAADRESRFTPVTAPVKAFVTGQPSIDRAERSASLANLKRNELIAAAILLVVLLLGLRAPIAALLVTAVGTISMLAGFGEVALLGHVLKLDPVGVAAGTMTGLRWGRLRLAHSRSLPPRVGVAH